MKLVHDHILRHDKPVRAAGAGGAAGAAAAFMSAFFLFGCATPLMRPVSSAPVSSPAFQPSSAPDVSAAEESSGTNRRTLLASWDRGRCVFENGRDISYSDDLDSRQRSLRLDSDARGARSVMCSEEFTVLMLPDRAIVSLGGRQVLEGGEMLGVISGRFISANSYEISLKPVAEEDGGVSSSSIVGMTLRVVSNAGRRWSIDLADPYPGWNVY